MADTEARIGYGTVLELALRSAPTVFTYIREIFEAAPPADSDDNVEASHMQSPGKRREYIPGMTDSGETSFEMNYVAGSATDIFLRSIRGKKLIARLTFATGVQVIFNANRQDYETAIPVDDRMTATLTLKVSGEPYLTTPTAPRNLVEPTISGVPQVGVPLTINPGDWAGATDIAFQWQADTAGNGTFVDISLATGESFVPDAAQLGDDVRCEVTATNGTFTTVVNSDETATVAAAA